MNVITIKRGSFKRNFIRLSILYGIFLILFSVRAALHLKIKMKTTSLTVCLNRSLTLPEVSNNSNKQKKLNRQIKYQPIRWLEIKAFSSAHLLLICPDIHMEDRCSARGSGIPKQRSLEVGPFPGCTGALLDSPHVVFAHTFIFF